MRGSQGSDSMSYIVATMQKFDRSMIKGMQSHNQREHESRTNADIDKSKEHLNYDLINESPINYLHAIDVRIKELPLKRKPRKDAVLINSFIIGSDKFFFESLTEVQQRKYFEDSLEWFKNRYGKENVLWGVVHNDEPTPHLHVGIMPVTSDLRLSSKDLFDRNELRAIQSELHADVGLKWGLERGKEGSDRKRLGELEYKLQQEKKKIKELEQKNETLTSEIEEKLEVSKMLPNVQELQSTISEIEEKERKLMHFVKKSENKPVNYQRTLEQLSSLDVSKDFLGRFKEITVETITWIINVAKNAVKRVLVLEKRIESLETQLELKQNPVQEVKSQLSKLEELKKQVVQVETSRVRTKQKNKDLTR